MTTRSLNQPSYSWLKGHSRMPRLASVGRPRYVLRRATALVDPDGLRIAVDLEFGSQAFPQRRLWVLSLNPRMPERA